MAIYIEINKKYEDKQVVIYIYSPSGKRSGELLIHKHNFELCSILSAEGEEDDFYVLRTWSAIRKYYSRDGQFPETACYAA